MSKKKVDSHYGTFYRKYEKFIKRLTEDKLVKIIDGEIKIDDEIISSPHYEPLKIAECSFNYLITGDRKYLNLAREICVKERLGNGVWIKYLGHLYDNNLRELHDNYFHHFETHFTAYCRANINKPIDYDLLKEFYIWHTNDAIDQWRLIDCVSNDYKIKFPKHEILYNENGDFCCEKLEKPLIDYLSKRQREDFLEYYFEAEFDVDLRELQHCDFSDRYSTEEIYFCPTNEIYN